jgi:3-oxoacyl-[acyl-carrier protein] reductase
MSSSATNPGSSRVALITGASNGMGKSTALRFMEAGWKILAVDLADGAPVGPECHLLKADITDEQALTAGLALVPEGFRKLGAVITAAGIYPVSNLDTLTSELYRKIFDVNVLGTLLVVKHTKDWLADGGSIVHFSSIDAFIAVDNQVLYSASKAAVSNATKTMAMELAPRGIRVNGVAPGWVRTQQNIANGRMERFLPSVPLKRAADPEEIAELVFWLTTGEGARYITGETIVTSGGLYMR